MPRSKPYTDEEKAELLCNPYTFSVTDHAIKFTKEFKEFVLSQIDRPGMTGRKVFEMAGYNLDLFNSKQITRRINDFRHEAASPGGLKEPHGKSDHVKNREKLLKTRVNELEDRIMILEQQIEFLKKSQALRRGK